MTNRFRSRRTVASLLLAVGGCAMLSGCIVMVVPAATSGLIARSAMRHGGRTDADSASVGTAKAATPLATDQPAAISGTPSSSFVGTAPVANRRTADVPALVVPGSSAAASATSGNVASTWYDVIRFEAKTALGTPDERRADILRSAKDAASASCGSRPPAVLIDAATIGADDYSYVGSLHTMGYAILLTTRSATLPGGQVDALVKEGIPAPHPGETLFSNTSAGDAGLRARITSHYCVVGLVGGQAGDFPGSVLPGAPAARPGWFLIGKP